MLGAFVPFETIEQKKRTMFSTSTQDWSEALLCMEHIFAPYPKHENFWMVVASSRIPFSSSVNSRGSGPILVPASFAVLCPSHSKTT